MQTSSVGSDEVGRAAQRLAGLVWRTPVVRCDFLDAATGTRLWLKAENLQLGGSFKIRGALLATTRLAACGGRGVLAQSTGNHAIAVALAARRQGLATTVVLPEDALPNKVRRLGEIGARVVTAGTTLADRLAVLDELRERDGYSVVDPYENRSVVVGQGTATAELIEQVEHEGGRLDAIVVPIGGGSAIAGACLAVSGRAIDVVGAEPAAVPAFAAALGAGRPVTVPAGLTIADGLRPDRVGALPFGIARDAVDRIVPVPEAAIADALRAALLHARLLVEPAAATALAAAIDLGPELGDDVGVLLTGGNVETSLITSLLADPVAALT
ncbi:threonine ammonia-lyase [Actinomadura opuntiae]|uniref:threonine ammonia-lyase n=1 Tax=Actinomadura sp. OS1-43 TaxID=604315 RepID=UPI00255AE98B|nr:pyridoxal-phosphate dependent enzyme [Actinomadura sp. OS1-43]MDL4821056.1 pyridoxal-phosphate dependent enzyme [Actinomadura sp. OS1-43]